MCFVLDSVREGGCYQKPFHPMRLYVLSIGMIRSTCADRWFGEDRGDLLREIGVSPDEAEVIEQLDTDSPSQGEVEIECMVCFEDVGALRASRSRCGHTFCNDCWSMHLSDRIAEGELR
eukprot:COSAG02_NODE_2377_length_9006_cov_6.225864_5_plen_119_part_00